MESKRFHKGDLVSYQDIDTYSEVYGIIINDDVFDGGSKPDQYVKVRWTDGDVTTNNTLGMVKVRKQ